MYLFIFALCLSIVAVNSQFKWPTLNHQPKFPEDLHLFLGENPITRYFCQKSATIRNGTRSCKNANLLTENFHNGVDQSRWIIEEYIAAFDELEQNYEFVTYLNNRANLYVLNGMLHVRPIVITDLDTLRNTWNLRRHCTSQLDTACFHSSEGGLISPPVTSAKIRTKLTFKYGRITVKAKLPSGDWIFPIINLVSVYNPKVKIVIAFARGNAQLTTVSGEDVGAKVLYMGPMLHVREPARSKHLIISNSTEPFSARTRTYSCLWAPDSLKFYVDDQEYGSSSANLYPELNTSEFYLTVGVGAGGINDFPDDSLSNGQVKPWQNRNRNNIRDFFKAADTWSRTWKNGSEILLVESIEIRAV